jgi:lysozyme family protein/WD40 repeat protein
MGDRRSAYATSHSGKSAMSQSDSATSTQPSERLKVFVSYARVNVGFADQLVMVLEDKGYIPILDRHDIVAGEPWEERLRKLIFSSDACVFVLTQASAASVICRWEVQEALRLGKRLVPVVPEGLGSVDAPPELAALNWIHFYADPAIPGSGFYDGVRKVDQALKVDLRWLRQHTKLAEDAGEWDAMGRPEDLLMRGLTLKDIDEWLRRAPAGTSVQPTVREFINASQEAQELRDNAARVQIEKERQQLRRQKRQQLLLSGLTVLIFISSTVFGVLVFQGRQDLDKEKQRVEQERLKGQTSRSQVLSDAALQQLAAGDVESATRLAIAGVREGAVVGGVAEANAALFRLLSEEVPLRRLRGHLGSILSVDVSGDGQRAVTASTEGRIIVRSPGKKDWVISDEFRQFVAAALLPDGIIAGDDSGDILAWVQGQQPVSVHDFLGSVRQLAASRTGSVIVAGIDDEGSLGAWEQSENTWHEQSLPDLEGGVATIALSADGGLLLVGRQDGVVQILARAGSAWSAAATFKAHDAAVASIQLTADQSVLTVSRDGQVKLWNATGSLARDLTVAEPATAAALSPLADVLARATQDGVVRVIDLSRREAIKAVRVKRGIKYLQFLADGAALVISDDSPEATIYGTVPPAVSASGSDLHAQWQRGSLESASLKGRLTLGEDGTLRVLAGGTGEIRGRTMSLGGSDRIVDFAFAPDGFTVAAITLPGHLHLFDSRAGAEIAKPLEDVIEVQFAPDSSAVRLLSASGSVRGQPLETVSRVSADELVSRACQRMAADREASVITDREIEQVVILRERLGVDICASELGMPVARDGRPFGDVPRVQMAVFTRLIDYILRWEGGDAGGSPGQPATKFGITSQVYDRFRDKLGLDRRELASLERSEALQIYYESYWIPSQAHRMPTQALALAQMDAAMNMGARRAIRLSQQAARMDITDGMWGALTNQTVLKAANADPREFARELLAQRRRFYEQMLEKNPRFEFARKGWTARVDGLEKEMESLHDVTPGA